jgi:hypothetical protein
VTFGGNSGIALNGLSGSVFRTSIGISTGNPVSGASVILFPDAANTLALRNGGTSSVPVPQTFNVYNFWQDASNYERGFIRYASNTLEIGHQAAGTGATGREVKISTEALKGGTASNPADMFYVNTQQFVLAQNVSLRWGSSTNAGTGVDTGLSRVAAAIIRVNNGSTGGGSVELIEQTAPAAPAANGVRIYAVDNGSGKTQLMALFATGAAQQIAIEP